MPTVLPDCLYAQLSGQCIASDGDMETSVAALLDHSSGENLHAGICCVPFHLLILGDGQGLTVLPTCLAGAGSFMRPSSQEIFRDSINNKWAAFLHDGQVLLFPSTLPSFTFDPAPCLAKCLDVPSQ